MILPNESVFIAGLDANQTMDIVRELRKLGLVQGTDFDFRYQQREYSFYGDKDEKPRGAEFYLREGKWCTYLTLKYAK